MRFNFLFINWLIKQKYYYVWLFDGRALAPRFCCLNQTQIRDQTRKHQHRFGSAALHRFYSSDKCFCREYCWWGLNSRVKENQAELNFNYLRVSKDYLILYINDQEFSLITRLYVSVRICNYFILNSIREKFYALFTSYKIINALWLEVLEVLLTVICRFLFH